MIWSVLAISLLLLLAIKELHSERNKRLELVMQLATINLKLNKTIGEFASVRVKHGQTWENFVPLMQVFEKELGPKENATFLGQPIDLIYFNHDEVVFVEVKTGNSRLSSKQRHIRNLIKDRKVRWAEVNDSLRASQATDLIGLAAMTRIVPHRKLSDQK